MKFYAQSLAFNGHSINISTLIHYGWYRDLCIIYYLGVKKNLKDSLPTLYHNACFFKSDVIWLFKANSLYFKNTHR